MFRAIGAAEWEVAEQEARLLDEAAAAGDFFALFVSAARLVQQQRCAEALPALELLSSLRPNFVAVRELAYMCHAAGGDRTKAEAELNAIVAILPAGPQKIVYEQIRSSLRAERFAVEGYFEVVPSTNASRQTAATDLFGLTIPDNARGAPGVTFRGGVSVRRNFYTSKDFSIAGVARLDLSLSTIDQLLNPSLTVELPMHFSRWRAATLILSPFASIGYQASAHDATRLGLWGAGVVELGNAASLGWSGILARHMNVTAPWSDGWQFDNNFNYSRPVASSTRMTASLATNIFHSDDPLRRFFGATASLRFDHLSQAGLVLGGQASVGARWHSRPPPLSTGPNQSDTHLALRGEIGHRKLRFQPLKTLPGLMPSLYYEFRKQWSDNVFYQFDSHDIGIQLKASY